MELLTTNNKICFTIQCLIVDKKSGRMLYKFGRMFNSPSYENELMEIKMAPVYAYRYIGKKNKNYNYLLYRRCYIPINSVHFIYLEFINEIPKAMVQCSEEGQKRGLARWKHLPRTTFEVYKIIMRNDADKTHRFILILKKDNSFFTYCIPSIVNYYFYQHCVVGGEIKLPPASMAEGLKEVEIKGELK